MDISEKIKNKLNLKTNTFPWKIAGYLLFLLVVIIVGIVYVGKPQELRQKAALAGTQLSLNPATKTAAVGTAFNVGVVLAANGYSVTAAELHLSYDPTILQITAVTPGLPLPVVLTPATFGDGSIAVTLGAQPQKYLVGSDIVATIRVKILKKLPATISFTGGNIITATQQNTNTLSGTKGISINGIAPPTPTPYTQAGCIRSGCNGELCVAEGSGARNSICIARPEYACYRNARCEKQSDGICGWTQTDALKQCLANSTCIPRPACLSANPPCVLDLVPGTVLCPVTPTSTPTPTPPIGCRYVPVKCVMAPCDSVLVCPSITPTPTCSPRPACLDASPPCIMEVVPGTRFCQATPTPTPGSFCQRNAPSVTINPSSQSGYPGDSRRYTVTIRNNDSGTGCGVSPFTVNIQIPSGWTSTQISPFTSAPGSTTQEITVTSAQGDTGDNLGRSIQVTATNTASGQSGSYVAVYQLLSLHSQMLSFLVKLQGVPDGRAAGSTMIVRFIKSDGTSIRLNPPLTLNYWGDGIYRATADLTQPLTPGTKFVVKVKGEKHASIKFCQTNGQTGPCADDAFITVPQTLPLSYDFNFTGIPLQPGDLPLNPTAAPESRQDGVINQADIDKLRELVSKIHSSLTPSDLYIADLNYDGYIDARDAILMAVSLATRYDQ